MTSEKTMLLKIGAIGLSKCGGRKPSTLAQAAAHNLRTEQNERGARGHIDASRTGSNRILAGPDSPAKVQVLAMIRMAEADVDPTKLRRDYVQAVELLISLPPHSGLNEEDFFAAAVGWAGQRFGAENLLSAVVHRDEACPHLHVLVLPLLDGRMNGRALKTSQAIQETTRDFFERVARPFGLRQPERTTPAHRAALAAAVLARMQSTPDPCLKSALWPAMRAAIEANPAPFAEVLGIEVEPKKKHLRTLTQVMTGTGRKTSEDRERKGYSHHQPKTIGIGGQKTPMTTLCSLRPAPAPEKAPPRPPPAPRPAPPPPAPPQPPQPAPPAPAPHLPDQHDDDQEEVLELVTRVRDCDLDPSCYDAATGDFRPPPPPAPRRRDAADSWVSGQLHSIKASRMPRPH